MKLSDKLREQERVKQKDMAILREHFFELEINRVIVDNMDFNAWVELMEFIAVEHEIPELKE